MVNSMDPRFRNIAAWGSTPPRFVHSSNLVPPTATLPLLGMPQGPWQEGAVSISEAEQEIFAAGAVPLRAALVTATNGLLAHALPGECELGPGCHTPPLAFCRTLDCPPGSAPFPEGCAVVQTE